MTMRRSNTKEGLVHDLPNCESYQDLKTTTAIPRSKEDNHSCHSPVFKRTEHRRIYYTDRLYTTNTQYHMGFPVGNAKAIAPGLYLNPAIDLMNDRRIKRLQRLFKHFDTDHEFSVPCFITLWARFMERLMCLGWFSAAKNKNKAQHLALAIRVCRNERRLVSPYRIIRGKRGNNNLHKQLQVLPELCLYFLHPFQLSSRTFQNLLMGHSIVYDDIRAQGAGDENDDDDDDDIGAKITNFFGFGNTKTSFIGEVAKGAVLPMLKDEAVKANLTQIGTDMAHNGVKDMMKDKEITDRIKELIHEVIDEKIQDDKFTKKFKNVGKEVLDETISSGIASKFISQTIKETIGKACTIIFETLKGFLDEIKDFINGIFEQMGIDKDSTFIKWLVAICFMVVIFMLYKVINAMISIPFKMMSVAIMALFGCSSTTVKAQMDDTLEACFGEDEIEAQMPGTAIGQIIGLGYGLIANEAPLNVRRANDLLRFGQQSGTLIETICDNLEKISYWIAYQITKDPKYLRYDGSEKYEKFVAEVTEILLIDDLQTKLIIDDEVIKRVSQAYNTAVMFNDQLSTCPSLSIAEKQNFKYMVSCIKSLYSTVSTDSTAYQSRPPPVYMYIHGPSGQGKTMSSDLMPAIIYSRLQYLRPDLFDKKINASLTFHKTMNSDYWDGYAKNFCICLQEVFQATETNILGAQCAEVFRINETAPYVVNMAKLEGKGTTKCISPLVISTSNFTDFKSLPIHVPEALTRRITFAVEIRRKDNFKGDIRTIGQCWEGKITRNAPVKTSNLGPVWHDVKHVEVKYDEWLPLTEICEYAAREILGRTIAGAPGKAALDVNGMKDLWKEFDNRPTLKIEDKPIPRLRDQKFDDEKKMSSVEISDADDTGKPNSTVTRDDLLASLYPTDIESQMSPEEEEKEILKEDKIDRELFILFNEGMPQYYNDLNIVQRYVFRRLIKSRRCKATYDGKHLNNDQIDKLIDCIFDRGSLGSLSEELKPGVITNFEIVVGFSFDDITFDVARTKFYKKVVEFEERMMDKFERDEKPDDADYIDWYELRGECTDNDWGFDFPTFKGIEGYIYQTWDKRFHSYIDPQLTYSQYAVLGLGYVVGNLRMFFKNIKKDIQEGRWKALFGRVSPFVTFATIALGFYGVGKIYEHFKNGSAIESESLSRIEHRIREQRTAKSAYKAKPRTAKSVTIESKCGDAIEAQAALNPRSLKGLALNSASFKIEFNSGRSVITHVEFVEGCHAFAPSHTFTHDPKGIKALHMLDGEGSKVMKTFLRNQFEYKVLEDGRDLVAITIPGLNMKKKITKRLISKDDAVWKSGLKFTLMKKFVDQTGVYFNFFPSTGTSHTLLDDRKHSKLKFDGNEVRTLIDKTIVAFDVGTEKGDCGFPYYVDKGGVPFLAGLHVAGCSSNAYVTPIFKEDMDHFIDVAAECAEMPVMDIELSTKDLDNRMKDIQCPHSVPNCLLYGSTSRIMYTNPKSEFICSPMQAHNKYIRGNPTQLPDAIEVFSKPAHLWIFEHEGEMINPWEVNNEKQLSAYTPGLPLKVCEKLLDLENLFDGFFPENMFETEGRRLTVQEAVLGTEKISSFSGSDSMGLWGCMDGEKKSHHINLEEGYVSDELIRRVSFIRDKAQNNKCVPYISKDNLKDEPRPIEKVDQGKTRLFKVGSCEHNIHIKCVLGDFLEHMKERFDTGAFWVGVNPHQCDWGILYKRITRHPNLFGSDIKSNDFCIPQYVGYWLFVAANLFYRYIPNTKEWYELRITCMKVLHSCVYREGIIYFLGVGQPSGNLLTVIINSIAQWVMLRVIFDLKKPSGINFNDHVCATLYGDDNIGCFSDEIKDWFNLRIIGKYYAKWFGLQVTTPDKSTVLPETLSLEHADFLSREFRVDQGYVKAPLKLTSIHSMLNWIRKSDNDKDQFRQNVEHAFMELYHHGRETFIKYEKIVRRRCLIEGIPFSGKSYNAWDQRYKHQYTRSSVPLKTASFA